jgi:hypothetical protein
LSNVAVKIKCRIPNITQPSEKKDWSLVKLKMQPPKDVIAGVLSGPPND